MASTRFGTLPYKTRAYVASVVTAGAVAVLQSFYALTIHPIGWNWAILAVLTLASGSATVRLPSLPATISVSETFVFTSVLLFGSAAGTVTVALDALVISFWSYRKGHPLYKVIFNVCALPLTIWLAAHIFFLFPATAPLTERSIKEGTGLKPLVGPLLIFTLTYFLLNSWIITFAISLERRLQPLKVWRDNFVWLSLNYLGGASVAALLVSYTKDLDFTYLAVIVPLLVVLYLTFSISVGRVEDANQHLVELNKLYMSTIETLAMAIDAKDQITHGHIRRVQTYAVALAKEVGVTDGAQIKAIEAAALLHDMGKLAVPEHILNKPGPLTPAEFEKMKLHASIGADILASINFPYPVVPIVRHHHENWDGSGYPDRLDGTNIPIGARILSVVDCFDALTSDRPYRPKLSEFEALRILTERRGSMYDPVVIDTFTRTYKSIVLPCVSESAAPVAAQVTRQTPDSAPTPLDEISAGSEETLALFELAKDLASARSHSEIGAIVCRHLRRLVPLSTCALFTYESASDELVALFVEGEHSGLLQGTRVARGQRLTGWVAANRRTIRNSDPILDLGDSARSTTPKLRSCLSTPVVFDSSLVGVLTVYSTVSDGFSEDHQRVVELVGWTTAGAITRLIDKQPEGSTLVSLDALDPDLFGNLMMRPVPSPAAILVVTLHDIQDLPDKPEDIEREQAIRLIAPIVQANLGVNELLIQSGDGQLAAILLRTHEIHARQVHLKVGDQLGQMVKLKGWAFTLSLTLSIIPSTGITVADAIDWAKREALSDDKRQRPPRGLSRGQFH